MKVKKYRVREDTYKTLIYAEWKMLQQLKKTEVRNVAQQIISYSLEKIEKEKLVILMEKYREERFSLGFAFTEETMEKVQVMKDRLNLFAGELLEACIFLYYLDHFTVEDLKINEMDTWGISIKTSNSK